MPETSTSSSDQSNSQDSRDKQSQVPVSDGLKSQNGDSPVFPVMYPMLVPGLLPPHQHQEQINRGPGLYAVPVHPYMQSFGGFPSNALIPFTYNLPTERSSPEAREVAGEQGQQGEQPQQQQQAGPQRQVVVRRFQIAIQLDILLILKLAAVIFLFNQDGSRQRLTLLVFFASLVYLYQTGALAPVIQWLSQGMRRAAAPPARPAARADNLPAAGEQGNENAGVAEGQPLGENENEQANDGNRGIENEHAGEGGQGEGGNRLWVIVKEIQMIVFGFITSLLPGFHNVD
ncbi:transmembrane protein [Perilla frutescens var. hirtella]|uniref:Transmembrane protein n=1 Tax=Perilla frutescens var. hirtella TaxID=608512 RepID=A0AAD4IL77_PERFH|nr:transmembrane protein [Perilla frutescens var. hirtella]